MRIWAECNYLGFATILERNRERLGQDPARFTLSDSSKRSSSSRPSSSQPNVTTSFNHASSRLPALTSLTSKASKGLLVGLASSAPKSVGIPERRKEMISPSGRGAIAVIPLDLKQDVSMSPPANDAGKILVPACRSTEHKHGGLSDTKMSCQLAGNVCPVVSALRSCLAELVALLSFSVPNFFYQAHHLSLCKYQLFINNLLLTSFFIFG